MNAYTAFCWWHAYFIYFKPINENMFDSLFFFTTFQNIALDFQNWWLEFHVRAATLYSGILFGDPVISTLR